MRWITSSVVILVVSLRSLASSAVLRLASAISGSSAAACSLIWACTALNARSMCRALMLGKGHGEPRRQGVGGVCLRHEAVQGLLCHSRNSACVEILAAAGKSRCLSTLPLQDRETRGPGPRVQRGLFRLRRRQGGQ